ncbi:sensor histidine kinase [Spirosoma pollinicola]|uniref:Sensor histidine kinase n=1 Tax=Spirosoma pollinicola TaxID=2057025 RepID=A0A2K8Z7R9_9BACT|nr:sensor histidine kinase [Spirosoma pollinicola]AUD05937.1 sensor histidine kinase [Spirosoma pollinicola]
MNRKAVLLLIHIVGCLAFLAFPYVFAEDGMAKLAELPYNSHERRNVASYLLTIGFFYLNFYVLISRLFFRRNYVVYGLSALGCFLVIQGILATIVRQGHQRPLNHPSAHRPPPPFPNLGRPPLPPVRPSPMRPPPVGPPEISQTFFLFLVGLLLSLAIRINNRWRETERQRLDTELSYLKAQINPHFLFNTLNSIYSLAIVESPPTADAIVQLSSFLRYVIDEGRQNRVALSHELAYIGHYIALQRLRLAETVPIDFSTTVNPNGLQIAPLLLISFIENAFKYGVSPQDPARIDILIELNSDQLYCYVFNRKVRVADSTALGSGIGLTNAKVRLQLLYPGRHVLVINDQPDCFTVELNLTLS